jgi:hypothetical protein
MADSADRPERELVRRALGPSVLACIVGLGAGWLLGGPGGGASAAIGVALVTANFAAHGLSLAWASTVSIAAVQAVALGGFFVRLALLVGVMFELNRLSWFSPLAFGLVVVPTTLLLLAYETRLVLHGMGGVLQIPQDRVTAQGAAIPAAREG